MLFVECAFCHRRVFSLLYPLHRARHTRRLPDGQMADHITARPDGRYQGSLEGCRCGIAAALQAPQRSDGMSGLHASQAAAVFAFSSAEVMTRE